MTRTLLLACRHRLANDAMARGEESDPLVDEIDAVLAEPRAALRWHEFREALMQARDHLRKNRASWNGPQFQAVWAINKALGENPVEDQPSGMKEPKVAEGAHTSLPWTTEILGRGVCIKGEDGYWVALIYGDDADMANANANLIVAAVNSHHDMLAALEPFAIWACDSDPDDPDDLKVDDLGVCDITLGHCRAARSAYRKAKGAD